MIGTGAVTERIRTMTANGSEEVSGVKLANWESISSSIKLPREITDISAAFLTEALQARFPGKK